MQSMYSITTPSPNVQLRKAVQNGDLKTVKKLVAAGAEFTEVYLDTFPEMAAASGNIELLKYLLDDLQLPLYGSKKTDEMRDPTHDLLRAAARSGSSTIMHYLTYEKNLPLREYVGRENRENLAYQYNAFGTILGEALKTNVNFVRYLFEEEKLAPPPRALAHLKKDAAFHQSLQLNAYLDSYLVNSEEDKTFLTSVAQQDLKKMPLPQLFKLYNYPLLKKGGSGDFQMEIFTAIEERKLDKTRLSDLATDPETLNDMLFYYTNYHFTEGTQLIYLLEEYKGNVNAINRNGDNLILSAYHQSPGLSCIDYLLKNGVNVDYADPTGRTALNYSPERFLQYSKDPRQALQYAVTEPGKYTLERILKETKGEIGSADLKQLFESVVNIRQIPDLIQNLSKTRLKELKEHIVTMELPASLKDACSLQEFRSQMTQQIGGALLELAQKEVEAKAQIGLKQNNLLKPKARTPKPNDLHNQGPLLPRSLSFPS